MKILMISSSGGHFEQLIMLKSLETNFDLVWVSEKTDYEINLNYHLAQTGLNDRLFVLRMMFILVKSLIIWFRESPDFVISTGAVIALPMLIIAKIFRKKVIFIETFARVFDGTKSGMFAYKLADLFIIQWETLSNIYPNAVFGGSIY
jgi:beta-1,4-N-acetylglucosaminyltransferase